MIRLFLLDFFRTTARDYNCTDEEVDTRLMCRFADLNFGGPKPDPAGEVPGNLRTTPGEAAGADRRPEGAGRRPGLGRIPGVGCRIHSRRTSRAGGDARHRRFRRRLPRPTDYPGRSGVRPERDDRIAGRLIQIKPTEQSNDCSVFHFNLFPIPSSHEKPESDRCHSAPTDGADDPAYRTPRNRLAETVDYGPRARSSPQPARHALRAGNILMLLSFGNGGLSNANLHDLPAGQGGGAEYPQGLPCRSRSTSGRSASATRRPATRSTSRYRQLPKEARKQYEVIPIVATIRSSTSTRQICKRSNRNVMRR